MIITIHYQKNEKVGEVRRQARWVVRENSDETTDRYFVLTPGQHGARAHSFAQVQTYLSLAFGITDLNQICRGLWTSEPIKKVRVRAHLNQFSSKPTEANPQLVLAEA